MVYEGLQEQQIFLNNYIMYYTESLYYFLVWSFYYLIASDEDNKIFSFVHNLQNNKIIEGKVYY